MWLSYATASSDRHNGYQREARSARADAVPILFAVEPTDEGLARLGETLARVSDPTHADYGQYLSREETISLTANPASEDVLEAWLNEATWGSATHHIRKP